MKKIICLALILAMLFSGCSKWEVEIVDPTKPLEGESELAVPEEEEKKLFSEHEEEILDYIWGNESKGTKCIDFNTWSAKIREKGIDVYFDNVSMTDDWYWKAKIVFEKNGSKLIIPVEGMAYYSEEYENTKAYFGAFDSKDGYSVYYGKENAVFFDTETLEVWDFTPKFEKYGFDDIWVNGAAYDSEKECFYLLTTVLNKYDTERRNTVINVYDKEGNLVSEKQTERGCLTEYADCDYVFPRFVQSPDFFRIDEKTFFSFNSDASELIDSESGEYFTFHEVGDYEDGKYRFELKTLNRKNESGNYIAFIYDETGEIAEWFSFKEDNLSTYYEEIDVPEVTVSSDGKTASYYSDYFAMTLELDFENKTHTLKYEPEDRHISEEAEKTSSSDGKYSICHFGKMGGGDAWYSHIALKNNETGKYSYLGKTGGMYGGHGGYGFLKNNDVYLYSVTGLEIFDPETGKVKFDINENFPLGFSADGKQGRGILTFRRDPGDFSYIVVYYEFEDGYSWKTSEREEFYGCDEASFNYRIGFLDSEGNLLESYDTGLPVLSDSFGYYEVEMRYSKEKLNLFFTERKADIYIEGVFDMETKEFTII
ncbi:MAG: hypothetical protein E7479_03395 [Ruminococcaceae bacterium]|nr:hypothetical protein [Oscillospiraceae bacterium]